MFEKMKTNNDEIRESNERYDIVAKATSIPFGTGRYKKMILSGTKGIQVFLAIRKKT
jgi:hypothetical protein